MKDLSESGPHPTPVRFSLGMQFCITMGGAKAAGRDPFLYLLYRATCWSLPFVGVCQVPKRFVKEKISSSPSVWHF